MLTNFPDGVSSFGIPVLPGGDFPSTTGKVFFVDSNLGNNGNSGKSPTKAVATISNAAARCRANKGDLVVVMPGHAENIATATDLAIAIAGVTVVGLGSGSSRPTLTFTATAGSVELDAANVTLANIVFKSSVTAVVVGVNFDGADCALVNCEFTFDATGDDFLTMVDIDAVNGGRLIGCKFVAEDTAGCDEAVRLDTCDDVVIKGCHFYGDFTNAAVLGEGALGKNLLIDGNTVYNSDTTAGMTIDLNVAFTGLIVNNRLGTLYAADPETAFDPGSCLSAENYAVNAVDESGTIVPTLLST